MKDNISSSRIPHPQPFSTEAEKGDVVFEEYRPPPLLPQWRGGWVVRTYERFITPSIIILASVVVFLLYAPVFSYGFQAFDDDLLVFTNPIVVHPSFPMLHRAFTTYDPELYVPLTLVSYQIDSLIGSMRPEVFHTTNIFLHLLTGLLVMWWLSLLLKPRFLSVIVGLLFLVHPINIETVAWIAARKDLLSGCFAVATLLTYTFALQKSDKRLYWLSIELFALALLAKASVVTLPALLLCIDLIRGRRITWSVLREKIPFAFLSALFMVIAMAGKANTSHTSAFTALLFSGQATALTLWHVIWPMHLSVLYPYEGMITVRNLWLTLPTIGLWTIALGALFWKRVRFIALWLWFFLIALVPSYFTVMKAGHAYITSDRYGYIGLIGLFTLFTFGVHHISRSLRTSLQIVILTFIIAVLSILTRLQIPVWENGVTLFTQALSQAPRSLIALNNRAQSLMLQKRYSEAESDLRRGIEIDPEFHQLHVSLAELLQKQGKNDLALKEYLKALSLDPMDAESHLAIGNYFRAIGDDSEAKAAYSNAYLLNPALIEKKLETAGYGL